MACVKTPQTLPTQFTPHRDLSYQLDSEQRHVDPVYLLQMPGFSVAGVLGGWRDTELTLREVVQLLVYFL